jgi:hypothetical protein
MRGVEEVKGAVMVRRCLVGVLVVIGMLALACGASAAPTLPPLAQIGPNQPASVPPSRLISQLAPGATAATTSYNWSGYVAGNGSELFKSVSSTYVQPKVTCPVSGAYTVFWVGLDGWFDGTVEQDGTLAYCNGTTPEYFAWWEMYPTNDIQSSIPISPGDTIQASVKYTGGRYTLAVKDKTARSHFTTHQTCASGLTCERTSADWIIERPGIGNGYAPLADWGTTSLASDKAASNGRALAISAFPSFGVNMVSETHERALATVGALNTAGNSFPDTWVATK